MSILGNGRTIDLGPLYEEADDGGLQVSQKTLARTEYVESFVEAHPKASDEEVFREIVRWDKKWMAVEGS